jgi:16S rRNA (guanine966-N2)-methyltransferase
VRVIAGEHRGRRLEVPRGTSVRPTSDRVREALFSILGDVGGARVLDLFAGSGALGIEALSRGAGGAVFVENDPRALAALRANVEAIGGSGAEVVRADALSWLRRGGRTFDLLFLDPPYSCAGKLAGELSTSLPAVLSETARIVSESDKRQPLTLSLPLLTERSYGNTRIAIHSAAR